MSSSQAICTDLDALLAYEDRLGYSKPSTSFWKVEVPEPRPKPVIIEDAEPVLTSLPLPPRRHEKKTPKSKRRPKSAGGTPVMLQSVLTASMSRSATPDSIISDDHCSTTSHQSSPAVLPSFSRRNHLYPNPYLNPVPADPESTPNEPSCSNFVDSPQSSWTKVLSEECGSSDGTGSVTTEHGEWVAGLSREDGHDASQDLPAAEEPDQTLADHPDLCSRNSRLKRFFPRLGRKKARPSTADASIQRQASPLNTRYHSSSASTDMYVPAARQISDDRAVLPYTSDRLLNLQLKPEDRRRRNHVSHASTPTTTATVVSGAGSPKDPLISCSVTTTSTSTTTAAGPLRTRTLNRPLPAQRGHPHSHIYITPHWEISRTVLDDDHTATPASSVFHLDPSDLTKMSDFTYKPHLSTTSKPHFFTTNKSTPNLSVRPKTSPLPSPTLLDEVRDRSLGANQRAHLVRKSRKLTQLFGQTPQANTLVSSSFLDVGTQAEQPKVLPIVLDISKDNSSVNPDDHARRHSTPASPDQASFASNKCGPDDASRRRPRKRSGKTSVDISSRASFISLSDDETSDLDVLSPITPIASYTRPRIQRKPSEQSLATLSPEEEAEVERRRNRDKLAKLHRFLGSRVPTNLVLGVDDPLLSFSSSLQQTEIEKESRPWMRRRNSSSAAIPSSPSWADENDRTPAELDSEEKARDVRRAVKMERVFGVAPPQTLYRNRHTPALSISTEKPPMIHLSSFDFAPLSISPTTSSPSILRKRTRPKSKRSSSRDSSEHLLPKSSMDSSATAVNPATPVFVHYQHSLNTLNDMIDRDDRESLAQLHEYLNGDVPTVNPKRSSVASSVRTERRRSLPARASNASLASQFTLDSLVSPPPDVTDFQIRRRRAAKLMSFFGVDYKELITDVLNSIEEGVDNESIRGTINADEVEDLLRKLRQIKSKRDGLF